MDDQKTLVTAKIDTTVEKCKICKTCIICGEGFEMKHDNDPRMICPTCIKKLRKLINEVPDE